jgi:N-acetylglutamate synthase-like GNAT family acetyltransferase
MTGVNSAPERAIEIRRPTEADWEGILAVLRPANFAAIGSPEMPTFPLSDCFVAIAEGNVIGVGGYKILDADNAKTSLLAVDPAWRKHGVGAMLQEARLAVMRAAGVCRIYTNTDDQSVIDWLTRRYGFRATGQLIPKICPFGDPAKDHWVNLVLEL